MTDLSPYDKLKIDKIGIKMAYRSVAIQYLNRMSFVFVQNIDFKW